jgi:hypothetical protein
LPVTFKLSLKPARKNGRDSDLSKTIQNPKQLNSNPEKPNQSLSFGLSA